MEGRMGEVRSTTTTTTEGATNTNADATAVARRLLQGLRALKLLQLLLLVTRRRHKHTAASVGPSTTSAPINASESMPWHRVEMAVQRRQDDPTPGSAAIIVVGAVTKIVVTVRVNEPLPTPYVANALPTDTNVDN